MKETEEIRNNPQLKEADRLFSDKDYRGALNVLLDLLESAKTNALRVRVFRHIAVCYGHLDEFQTANLYSLKCFQDNDNPISATYYRALYSFERCDYESSLPIFQQLLKEDPECFDKGNLELKIGTALAGLKRYEEATRYFAAAHRLLDSNEHPSYFAHLLYEYGDALYELDRLEDAALRFEECKQWVEYLTPASRIVFYYLYGSLLYQLERYESALPFAEQAVSLATSNIHFDDVDVAKYLLKTAQTLTRLDRFEEALELANEVDLSRGDEWEEFIYYENLTWALYMLGRDQEVIGPLRKFLALDKIKEVKPAVIYDHTKMLAISLFETGEKKESKELFEKLIDDPLSDDVDKTLFRSYIAAS